MAKNNYRRSNSYNANYKKKSYSSSRRKKSINSSSSPSALKRLAYQLGLVKRGINNPDSALHESYQKGFEKPQKKVKKSLF